MATIDMSGKWNLKISGLKIDNTTYPIMEIYFNLGYAVNVSDVLDFGTRENFGYDLQVRLNTIGNSYSFIGCGGFKKPSDLNFEPVEILDSNGRKITQTISGNNTYQSATVTIQCNVNDVLYYIAFSYSSPYGYGYNEGFSPLYVLHDEFTDKIIGTLGSYTGAIIQSNEPMLSKLNDIMVSNTLPVVYSSSVSVTVRVSTLIDNILETINPSDSDPYNPNGEPAGGGGETQTSDEMQDETLPTISVADTGFVTLYKPSISQMNALASYMWGSFDVDAFKKVFANPMDVILGLSILPGIVPAGGSSNVMVGNVNTGVSMTKVANQYVKFDCGSVTVKRRWGAFLDYSPYTKAFIYLPFIGVEPIDVDEIMNKTVSVTYNIDVLSGGCCAFIKVDGTTLYSYIGQCACSVPVTGKDWSTMINGVLGAVSGITGTIGSLASGNVAGAVSGIASVAQNVTGAKPTYQRSGSMGGMGGMMGIKTPYIIIERPVQAVPGYQNKMIGYPSFITRLIGDFQGYTEIEQCHLENIPCTGEELTEIEGILKTGVIL